MLARVSRLCQSVCLISLLLTDIVTASPRSEWKQAQNSNSIAAYQRFVEAYPEDRRAEDAHQRIVELTADARREISRRHAEAMTASSIEAISKFFEGSVDDQARVIDSAEWSGLIFALAADMDTVAAYELYLDLLPVGADVNKARAALDVLLTQGLDSASSAEAFARLLQSFPPNLNEILTRLEAHISSVEEGFRNCADPECSDRLFAEWDESVWVAANAREVRAEYGNYLVLFPDGIYADAATSAIDDIDWSGCRDGVSLEPCEAYLAAHSRGEHTSEAREKMNALKFEQAASTNTIESYEEFLRGQRNHPEAHYNLWVLRYDLASAVNNLDPWRKFYDDHDVSSSVVRQWSSAQRSDYTAKREEALAHIERYLFAEVIERPGIEPAREYLSRFRDGARRQQVIIIMEPYALEDAYSQDSVAAYKDYLEIYSDGYSSAEIRMALDGATYRDAVSKNRRRDFESYIDEFPAGRHVADASATVDRMLANPSVPSIDSPQTTRGVGSNPRFSWTTRISETSGRVGFDVRGSGWVITKGGSRYGPNGRASNRGTIKVPAGGAGTDSHWVRGSRFCGGRAEYTWSGTDPNGHSISMREVIHLECP